MTPGLRTIETYVLGGIKDIRLPGEIPNCPLSLEARRLLMAHCPVVLIDPTDETERYLSFSPQPSGAAYDTTQYALWQAGPDHKRSFVLDGPNLGQPWCDEYGNKYKVLTLKGNNFTDPHIIEHPAATQGFIAWGLQESAVMGRVLAASEVLARHGGISGERILALAEPKKYPWPIIDRHTDAHEYIDLEEYQRRIVERHWQDLPDSERTPEALAGLTDKFSDMTYLISLRAMDTAYRLVNACSTETAPECTEELNQYHLPPGQQPFDLTMPSERRRYLADFFAPQAAETLAALHEDLQLAHGYPNSLNWSMLAKLPDLDSVHGEALNIGDKPITNQDRAKDLVKTLYAIHIVHQNTTAESEEPRISAQEAMERLLHGYFDGVIARRGDSQQTIEYLGDILLHSGPAMEDAQIDDWNPEAGAQIIRLVCEQYVERFYRPAYDAWLVAGGTPSVESIWKLCQTGEELAEVARQAVDNKIEACMVSMFVRYAADMADPAFDPVSEFMQGAERSLAWKQLSEAVQGAIEYHVAQAVLDAQPAFLAAIQDPIIRLLVTLRLANGLSRDIETEAERHVAALVPWAEQELRTYFTFERSPSIFPGHASMVHPWVDAERLFMTTEGVPFADVEDYLHRFGGQLQLGQLPQPNKDGILQLSFDKTSELTELISFGKLRTCLPDSVQNPSRLLARYTAENTDYVLAVGKGPDGQPGAILLVQDAEAYIKNMVRAANNEIYIQPELSLV